MRQFQRRGKEVPMDFTYERSDRPLGPFTEALRKQSTSSQFGQSFGNPSPPTIGHSFSPSPFQNGYSNIQPNAPSRAVSPAEPPGGFNYNQDPSREPDEPQDISMSSDLLPSPHKEVEMTEVTTPEASPTKKKGNAAGQLVQRLLGRKKRQRSGEVAASKNKQTRVEDDASDNDAEDEASPHPVERAAVTYHFSQQIPTRPGDVPRELLHYVWLGFWAAVVTLVLFLLVWGLLVIGGDVEAKMLEYSNELLHEINLCSQLYFTNKCHPETRVPAMEATCQNWERCMNKDPKVISRARVYAETVGDMFNGFVEPLAWKTLLFTIATLACVAATAYFLFRLFENRHPPIPPSMSHTPSYAMLPPPTPSRDVTPMVMQRIQSPFHQEWVPTQGYHEVPWTVDSAPSTPQRKKR